MTWAAAFRICISWVAAALFAWAGLLMGAVEAPLGPALSVACFAFAALAVALGLTDT